MSVKIELTIPSLGRIVNKFDSLPRDLTFELSRAVDRAAAVLEREAKREAPVDTGRLMRSITTSREGPFQRSIAPHVHYAIYVHEGTRFISANPFLVRAVGNAEDRVDRIFGDTLDRVLKK